jgi:hypothetical protein
LSARQTLGVALCRIMASNRVSICVLPSVALFIFQLLEDDIEVIILERFMRAIVMHRFEPLKSTVEAFFCYGKFLHYKDHTVRFAVYLFPALIRERITIDHAHLETSGAIIVTRALELHYLNSVSFQI